MKICFVGQITNTLQDKITGGAERQVQLIAENMAKRNHEVICVIPDACAKNYMNGIRLISGWNPNYGIPGLRWLTYRIPSLRNILLNIKADVYYTRGFSIYAPTVVSISSKLKVISLINLASDKDIICNMKSISNNGNLLGNISNGALANYYFRFFGLKKASWVISQTEKQYNICRQFNIRSVIIPNIFEQHCIKKLWASKEVILWIGSISRLKGIPELARLTSMITDLEFQIVGPLIDASFEQDLQEIFSRRNVKWLGELDHNQVMESISNATIVINTSPVEGFSNVMIEAWSLGKPVVSLHANPNNLLTGDERLGDCANGNIETMIEQIRFWFDKSNERIALEGRARKYVSDNHAPEVICTALEKLFLQ